MAKNGILVDYQYCTGCYSCEVACQSELDLPLGQWGGEGQAAFLRLPLPGKMHGVRPCRRAREEARREASAVPLGAALRIGR